MPPLLGFAGVMAIITGALYAFFRMPIGAAIVEHIRASSGSDSPTQDRIDVLEQEVLRLQREMAETQERLDFAERILTSGEEK